MAKFKVLYLPHSLRCSYFLDSYAYRLLDCLCVNYPFYPSYETLAKETGMARSTVAKKLKELKAKGFFETKKERILRSNGRVDDKIIYLNFNMCPQSFIHHLKENEPMIYKQNF